MSLTPEDVRKVALLSRLQLTDEELRAQLKPLNDLLNKFGQLQALDVTGIEPTSHSVHVVNVLREDRAAQSLTRDDLLANAPEARDGCFVVPRVIAE